MIIVELSGGLGNQMFQYAAGRCLSEKFKVPLKLDTKYLLDHSNPRPDFVFRNYDLGIWNVIENFATDNDILEVTGKSRVPLSMSEKIYWRIKNTATDYSKNSYQEPFYQFDTKFYSKTSPLYLQGYWQSEKYFESITEIIRKEFSFKKPIQWTNIEIVQQIATTESICLNIRRGDYVSIQKTSDILGFVGFEYLHNGIKKIAAQVLNPHFFVFSDEIQWCKQNINLDFPITFVSNDNPNQTFKEDLALMQLCKHFIISNSSFAWWAAWLAKNPTKIIITPKKWFANKTDSTDLIPKTWLQL